jgi:superfamily II helicase
VIADKARFRSSRRLERIVGYRLPLSAFHGNMLEAISSKLNFDQLDPTTREQLLAFFDAFLKCKCRDSPFCGCPERKFTRLIIELRESGLDHRQMSGYLLDEFGIEIYPADLLSFLEDAVHVFEAIRDIACIQQKEGLQKKVEEHIALIER